MPFKVTETNSSYVEMGYYPEISDEIKALPSPKIIDDNITKMIKIVKMGVIILCLLWSIMAMNA